MFLCLWTDIAQSYGGPRPSHARDFAATLATIAPHVSREHPQHPWSSADSTVQSRYRAVVHLYAPKATPIPQCPLRSQRAMRDALPW
ncbi:hypothetical protein GCM10010384_68000 [Streptomyces djakartensis]|uniref:Uncharacterized protein n=1 Tax=Streptomyces djakartensis TaxID=68193 RepID=A0ABQ3AJ53_9ACTN|nr:hypothetical protein GCM10010384_68000 [Streptomyces djakartensis]